jgi:hypothetical protein
MAKGCTTTLTMQRNMMNEFCRMAKYKFGAVFRLIMRMRSFNG